MSNACWWNGFYLGSLMEAAAFRLSRLLSIPAWIVFALARPDDRYLGYDDLLRLNRRYRTVPKPSLEARQEQQRKWARRVARLARRYSLNHLLEVGCGAGFASLHLQRLGFQVSAIDIQDHLADEVRRSPVHFRAGDVCEALPFAANQFDLVFSINSFEHFQRPGIGLDEMIRVARPGGMVYLSFNPLYFSPWGLHASRRLGMPYPQLLFSEQTIQRFMDENRAELADTFDETSDKTRIGPYLNKFSLEQYRALLKSRRQHLLTLSYVERTSYAGLALIGRHAGLLKARSPSFEDLIIAGIKFVAAKKVAASGSVRGRSQPGEVVAIRMPDGGA